MNVFPVRVLVVDDDPTNRDLLTKIMERERSEVRHAGTGEACLAAIADYEPDLLLLDVVLPDVNGVDLCARIKAQPEHADMLVFLISGAIVSPEEMATGLEIGADDYITRPFDTREFLARIRAVYRLRESIRARAGQSRGAFSQSPGTGETARAFDQGALRDSHRELFDTACTKYRSLIEASINRRIYKNAPSSVDTARALATELGFARANARDIIDIHTYVLGELSSRGSARRALLLQEESRVVLIEVMGYVLNYYRLRS